MNEQHDATIVFQKTASSAYFRKLFFFRILRVRFAAFWSAAWFHVELLSYKSARLRIVSFLPLLPERYDRGVNLELIPISVARIYSLSPQEP